MPADWEAEERLKLQEKAMAETEIEAATADGDGDGDGESGNGDGNESDAGGGEDETEGTQPADAVVPEATIAVAPIVAAAPEFDVTNDGSRELIISPERLSSLDSTSTVGSVGSMSLSDLS